MKIEDITALTPTELNYLKEGKVFFKSDNGHYQFSVEKLFDSYTLFYHNAGTKRDVCYAHDLNRAIRDAKRDPEMVLSIGNISKNPFEVLDKAFAGAMGMRNILEQNKAVISDIQEKLDAGILFYCSNDTIKLAAELLLGFYAILGEKMGVKIPESQFSRILKQIEELGTRTLNDIRSTGLHSEGFEDGSIINAVGGFMTECEHNSGTIIMDDVEHCLKCHKPLGKIPDGGPSVKLYSHCPECGNFTIDTATYVSAKTMTTGFCTYCGKNQQIGGMKDERKNDIEGNSEARRATEEGPEGRR